MRNEIISGTEMVNVYRKHIRQINDDIQDLENSSLSENRKSEFKSILKSKKREYIRSAVPHAEGLLKDITSYFWGSEEDLERFLPVIEMLYDLSSYPAHAKKTQEENVK